MKRFIYGLFAALLLVAVGTGCRTAHGAGEDLENAGEAVQDATN